jgi:uncharacterized protein YjbJ (UPF0337 family)
MGGSSLAVKRAPQLGRDEGVLPASAAACLYSQVKSEVIMTAVDKAKNVAQEATGKAKEAVGKATGDESLEAEGKADQVEGNLKQAGEKVKDALHD